jgi:site-specific recombinase XerD
VKNHIRPPVKVDKDKRVVRGPNGRAHRWRLNVPASLNGGRKKRVFFKSEKEAKDHSAGLLEAHLAVSPDLVSQLKERGMTVSDAIHYALKNAPRTAKVDLGDACTGFLQSRKDKNCKDRYLAVLGSDISAFRGEFPRRTIDSVSREQIERYLGDLTKKDGETPASPKTRRNVLASINALFNYAVDRGWRGENPAASISKPILDESRPATLQPAQVAKLLETASRAEFSDIFPGVLLQLFAGVRRSELPHVRWEHMKDHFLRLDLTKTRQPRAVDMPEALIRWLATLPPRTGRVLELEGVDFNPKDTRGIEDAYTYRLSQLANAADVPLPKNVLRHTAITYRVGLSGSVDQTARWGGHTAAVLHKHYLGAATRADAERFYALLPPAGASNVVPLAAG